MRMGTWCNREVVTVRLVILKKGGEPGEVAINPAQVTHVRSVAGPFTDIYFHEHRVAVEGGFRQVLALLVGEPDPVETKPERGWITPARP